MKRCSACGEQIQSTARKCRFCGEMIGGRGGSRSKSGGGRKKKKSSSSTTIVIIIIVAVLGGGVLVMGCLAALFLPAMQNAREAARRSACKNNLKQIGLALHNYHDEYRSFPPAYVADENGRPLYSWRVLLLPYLEQGPLHAQFDLSQPWDSPANQMVLDNMPAVFACPSSPTKGNTTHYAGVFGANSVFTGAEGIRFRDITDGTSRTMVVGECAGAGIPWTKPDDIDIAQHPTFGDSGGFSSSHGDGLTVLYCDGSVRYVKSDMNPQSQQAMFTRNGGEVVDDGF